MPEKVIWTTLSHCCFFFFYFFKAFDTLNRTLATIVAFLIVFSYLYMFEMHAQAYDKLIWALTKFEWEGGIMKTKE